jgi:RNA polymerase sigma-70 factor (ECF subfamily)
MSVRQAQILSAQVPLSGSRGVAARKLEDESDLIRLAQQGEAEACAVLYDRHYDAVYRYCYYRVSDVAQAQDLTSEVFVRMVENLDTYRARGRPLLAWLYTIARNLITDMHRHNGKAAHVSLEDVTTFEQDGRRDMAHRVDRRLQADCLAAALHHLTEEQRQVILLRFMEDYRNGQVARILDKSEGAVKALQHRALKSLRRALEREHCYET